MVDILDGGGGQCEVSCPWACRCSVGLGPTGSAGRTPETRGGSQKYQELGVYVKMIFIGRDLLHVIAINSIAKN